MKQINEAIYFRRLASDMAEAKRRADLCPESSCWEELEIILAELQKKLDSPTPPRPYNPRILNTNIYDIEHGKAIKEARKRGFFD